MDISRHREIINPSDFSQPINIVGCGATGSWIATILSKMGFSNIILYDFDMIEEHNIPNQNYTMDDLGKSKVSAIADIMLKNNPDIDVSTLDIAVDENTKLKGIVFLLVDTMAARQNIYYNCIKHKIHVDLLIETRMGAEEGMIYTIDTKDYPLLAKYEETIKYTDDEAETSFCGTTISVLPTALSVASKAVWQLIRFINKEDYNHEIIVNYKTDEFFAQKLY